MLRDKVAVPLIGHNPHFVNVRGSMTEFIHQTIKFKRISTHFFSTARVFVSEGGMKLRKKWRQPAHKDASTFATYVPDWQLESSEV